LPGYQSVGFYTTIRCGHSQPAKIVLFENTNRVLMGFRAAINYLGPHMNSAEIEFLEGGNYLSFATLKKSGEYVATPVWFASDGDSYYIFSAGNAGKTKRLRNFSQCRVAACTMSGTVTGNWIEGEAFLLERSSEAKTALTALHRKYGWQMKITDALSRLSGKIAARIYIRVDLKP
jgi:PPOX class probable F420-dependent enzyme